MRVPPTLRLPLTAAVASCVEPVTARFVDVAFVVLKLVAMRSPIVASALLIADEIVPVMLDAVIEPPVMVGLLIVGVLIAVFVRRSIFCVSPKVLL